MSLQKLNDERTTDVSSISEILRDSQPQPRRSYYLEGAVAKRSKVITRLIILAHSIALVLIVCMGYLHVMEPITSRFLIAYDCEVVRPADAFATDYVRLATFWLRVSYACTALGLVQFACLLMQKRVESVFQGALLFVLIFLQVSDYLQKEWLFQSYQILMFGV